MNKLVTALAVLFCSSALSAQPIPPKPPKPPKPPHVQVKVDVGDLQKMVDQQIQRALDSIGGDPHIPPHVREAVKKRLEKVRIKVKKRMANIDPNDLDELGEELGALGEEIGEEMEDFGKEMEKWGKGFEKDMEKWGKDFETSMNKKFAFKNWKGPQVDVDVDFDDDLPGMHGMDDEVDTDLDDAIQDLGALKLDATQRQALKKLQATSDQQVAAAKRELERASATLRAQLENPSAKEADVSAAIDAVTKLEADIRKARILAWVNARKLLDTAQRKQVEAAVKGR